MDTIVFSQKMDSSISENLFKKDFDFSVGETLTIPS